MRALAAHLATALISVVALSAQAPSQQDFDVASIKRSEPGNLRGCSDSADSSNAPSIFTALEETLGLRLESIKGPVDSLIIDHADRPSEN